ncbi:MAG: glutaredoxin family protein [Betaproteobacteria bacterium]
MAADADLESDRSRAVPVRLTLLIRAYCHLCDDMRTALAEHAAETPVLEIDVDTDPALEARWGTLVPVLLADGQELCHYWLDTRALDAIVARSAGANSR